MSKNIIMTGPTSPVNLAKKKPNPDKIAKVFILVSLDAEKFLV